MIEAFKSTIDKLGVDIASAQAPPISFIEADDLPRVESVLKEHGSAIVWRVVEFSEAPAFPLYDGQITIGAKTVSDSGNYKLMELLSSVKETFSVNSRIEIKDYSAVSPGPVAGAMLVTGVTLNPQLSKEDTFGLRMFTVHVKVVAKLI